MLTRHYGDRLYKCRYIHCNFQRHGFDSQTSRNSHEKEHEKPWRCDVEGCDFEQGGFLSRKMRDEHLERFHDQVDTVGSGVVGDLDEEEFKHICLDIIKADDVSKLGELVASRMIRVNDLVLELVVCAAQYASPETMEILFNIEEGNWTRLARIRQTFSKLLIPQAVAGNNFRMLEYLLYRDGKDWERQIKWTAPDVYREDGLADVLANGNDEMINIFCRSVEQDLLKKKLRNYLVSSAMIAATAGDVYREQILLGLWKKIPRHWWKKNFWMNAMINVASTTCSLELAEFLVECGVPVDRRKSDKHATPLLHAARKDSPEAAELMKFILMNGGNPVVKIETEKQNRRIYVAEEKGARNISKWLGVTFDELVAQAREAKGARGPSDSPAAEKEAAPILNEVASANSYVFFDPVRDT